eukprot:CAMPEP_0180271532 /NCGR_PEP_ID=MMETSP0988-20121125/3767_1 /TAXON_ID=697907 /ORGANISM="non described non described, Strain CCMP2293" /LENGTH=170 /DNA_ID=CAMNT_0022242553 /DNA_START=150 /DNA_END=658 /DNA_ORIENTATION=+
MAIGVPRIPRISCPATSVEVTSLPSTLSKMSPTWIWPHDSAGPPGAKLFTTKATAELRRDSLNTMPTPAGGPVGAGGDLACPAPDLSCPSPDLSCACAAPDVSCACAAPAAAACLLLSSANEVDSGAASPPPPPCRLRRSAIDVDSGGAIEACRVRRSAIELDSGGAATP